MIRGFIMAVVVSSMTACGGSQGGTQPVAALEGDAVAIRFLSGVSALPLFQHQEKLYLLGEDGLTYEICLWNRSRSRIEAVVSVDGRDAVSGRVADYRKDRGYVILPDEEVCVEGFRKSLEEVAAFEFTSRGESYAAKMGDETNVGVIGVAVFDEIPSRPPVAIASDAEAQETAGAVAPEGVPSAESAASDSAEIAKEESEGIGTEYGDATASAAEIVPFKRRDSSTPFELLSVFYDDREGLEAAGIRIPENVSLSSDRPIPNPFPGAVDNTEYAPPPPGN